MAGLEWSIFGPALARVTGTGEPESPWAAGKLRIGARRRRSGNRRKTLRIWRTREVTDAAAAAT
ncbi:MAG: hypothetical protein WD076_06370 [Parvularculaceae bacterium]